jgi:hypothetical protein
LWALIVLAILNVFDTLSTLHILGLGGLELNPLMSWLLNKGPEWFILAKLIPPLIVLPLLAVHRFFTVGMYGINLLLLAYVCVFIVHLIMLSIIYV